MPRTALIVTIGYLVCAAPASAQLTANASPNRTGKASSVHFVINGSEAPISSRIPSALSVTLPPGFALDRKAVTARCGRISAALNECPPGSVIGSGSLTITVYYQGHAPRNVTFHLKFYLRSATSVLGVTFLAGVRVVPATLSTTHGILLSFNPLPAPPAFALVSYALQQITLNLGATHKVVQVRKIKSHGHVRRTRRTLSKSLIHNPARCSGTWSALAALSFPDGTSVQLPGAIPCS